MTVDEKHYPLNRDNLTPPIHLQLSQKQKTFSQFLLAFLISILNFNHLPKKKKKNVTHRSYVCGNTCCEKTWLDKCLKSLFSGDP